VTSSVDVSSSGAARPSGSAILSADILVVIGLKEWGTSMSGYFGFWSAHFQGVCAHLRRSLISSHLSPTWISGGESRGNLILPHQKRLSNPWELLVNAHTSQNQMLIRGAITS
jgi:hypothetical protein